MTSVLVTGGAGFVGSHTCKALHQAGMRPVVLDNLSSGHRQAVRWGPLVVGSINKMSDVERAFQEHDISAIIHFAAKAYVGESFEIPADYYLTNVVGTLNLMEAARRRNISNFIFSSSCATYGIPNRLPITEDTLQSPISPYGRSKLACEWVLRDYATYGVRHVALRYFNAAGADPEGELGELHEPETHLIPRAIDAALRAAGPLQVYGDDYPTPDGSCVRDYVHVTDLAEAHVAACQYLIAGGDSIALNLGSGHGYSVFDILAAVERITGERVPLEVKPRRPGDPPHLVADYSRAADLLGFVPRHSDIDTIVATAAAPRKMSLVHA